MFKYSYESPFGLLTLAEENNKLTNCNFGNSPKLPQNAEIKETKLIKEAWLQLQQYFNLSLIHI